MLREDESISPSRERFRCHPEKSGHIRERGGFSARAQLFRFPSSLVSLHNSIITDFIAVNLLLFLLYCRLASVSAHPSLSVCRWQWLWQQQTKEKLLRCCLEFVLGNLSLELVLLEVRGKTLFAAQSRSNFRGFCGRWKIDAPPR